MQRMLDRCSHIGRLWNLSVACVMMMKELKELRTLRQVDVTWRSLPRGLGKMYEMIITRIR